MTKVFTAGISAGATDFTATLGGVTTSISEASSTGGSPVALNLVANLGTACAADASDGCCTVGNFDAGIAITRDVVASGASYIPSDTNTIYVANTCSTGLVFPITNSATPTVGAVIALGTAQGNIQAIAADRTSNIWLAAAVIFDSASTNSVYTIAYGSATATPMTVTLAAGAQILSGYGDLTGYISAQPTSSGRYTYLHDTGLSGACTSLLAAPLVPASAAPVSNVACPTCNSVQMSHFPVFVLTSCHCSAQATRSGLAAPSAGPSPPTAATP